MSHFLSYLIAFLISFLAAPILRKIAIRSGILDRPGRRKVHKKTVPLLGGGAIYLGCISGIFLNPGSLYSWLPILIGSSLILLISLIDDIRGLSAQFRLSVELLVALIMVEFGLCVSFLPPGFWGDLGEILITVLWLVGVTNACNYLDGLDGLAVGSAMVNLFCFGIILHITRQPALTIYSAVLFFACLGFLPYNFKNARMFLGDAGSTFLGFNLACIAVSGNWAEDNLAKISIPILILGVPIFDMIFTTVLRIKEEKIRTLLEWLRYGGKDHFHHYLVDLGLHPQGAVIFIYFLTLSLGLSAIMLNNDQAIEALLSISQAAIIFMVIAALIVAGKRRRSGWDVGKRGE